MKYWYILPHGWTWKKYAKWKKGAQKTTWYMISFKEYKPMHLHSSHMTQFWLHVERNWNHGIKQRFIQQWSLQDHSQLQNEWVKKMWYIHKMEYDLDLKRKEILICYNRFCGGTQGRNQKLLELTPGCMNGFHRMILVILKPELLLLTVEPMGCIKLFITGSLWWQSAPVWWSAWEHCSQESQRGNCWIRLAHNGSFCSA